MKRAFLLLLASFSIAVLAAVFPATQLVKDINQAPTPVDSNPDILCSDATGTYLSAADATGLLELWRTDGSSAGTRLVHGFTTSHDSTYVRCLHVAANGIAFFEYGDYNSPPQLWRSDGTDAGTFLLLAQTANSGVYSIDVIGSIGNSPVMIMGDDAHGIELFVSDGTVAGTHVQVDVTPGPDGTEFNNSATVGGQLYFQSHQDQLWVSDLTAAGTRILHDFNLAPDSYPDVGAFMAVPGGIAFGYELDGVPSLWFTDGAADTHKLLDLPMGSSPMVVFRQAISLPNGRGVFQTSEPAGYNPVLWTTDGTAANTHQITGPQGDLVPGYPLFTLLNNKVLFSATTAATGNEIWSTDGVTTTLVADLVPGPGDGFVQVVAAHSGVGLIAFSFSAPNGERPVYITDGTTAGTRNITALNSDFTLANGTATGETLTGGYLYFWWIPWSNVGAVTPHTLWKYSLSAGTLTSVTSVDTEGIVPEAWLFDQRLFFALDDVALGVEPWVSDGTAAGTHLIASLAPESQNGDSSPGTFFPAGNMSMFRATSGAGNGVPGLWLTDGTAAGTVHVNDNPPVGMQSSESPRYARLGNRTVFAAEVQPNRTELWITDGTVPGTSLVADKSAYDVYTDAVVGSDPAACGAGFVVSGGLAYYGGRTGRVGTLFKTDGTGPGTLSIDTFAAAPAYFPSSQVCMVAGYQGRIYFSTGGAATNDGLQVYDPATGSHLPVLTSDGRQLQGVLTMVELGGTAWLFGSDGVNAGLWRTQGSAATTTLAIRTVDITDGWVDKLRVFNGALYFYRCSGGTTVCHLMRTDGTLANTITLAEASTSLGSLLGPATEIGNKLLFLGKSAAEGSEPWVTDGTVAGTHLLRDIVPGPTSGDVTTPVDFNGLTYFFAQSGANGEYALWRTDGTTQNTEAANALQAPATNYYPWFGAAAVVGQHLVMPAYSPAIGNELFGVENVAPTAAADSATTLRDTALSVVVLTNDADPDGALNPSSLRFTQAPGSGTARAAADGSVTYTPNAGFTGTDTFKYVVADNQRRESAPAAVTITVNAPPATPAPPSSPPPKSGGGGGGFDWLAVAFLALLSVAGTSPRRAHLRRHA